MAFCQLHYYSPALAKQTAANVILPQLDDKPGPYPVFYLLHGLSDDYTIWERRTSIERYVAGLPLIVVMPDGGRGFYTDAAEGARYEAAIVTDLIGFIDRTFHTRADRAGRAVGGLSMGGYGAVKLALKHPDLFCSANSHSGAVAFGHKPLPEEATEFRRILGSEAANGGGPNDCFALAEQVGRAQLPAIRIDCGVDDFLIEDNRSFHDHLLALDLPHEYAEYPGAHDWAYWDTHVQEAVAFHSKNLGVNE